MIEVRHIRIKKLGKDREQKSDRPFDPAIYVESTEDLFNSIDEIVAKIPESERYNVYYTLGHKKDMADRSRSWSHQDVIPFDLDNIDYIEVNGEMVPDPRYLEIFSRVARIDLKKCVVVATGNGIQVLVKPPNAITGADYFTHHKKFYAALLVKLKEELDKAGLKGDPDISAFEPNRLFRMPGTLNKKPGRPERVARAIEHALKTESTFDLIAASGLPNVPETEQVTEREIRHSKIDAVAVETGCEFLKWSKREPASMNEPQWYAMLSIVGRFENGREAALEYSKGHPSFSARVTEQKLEQALKASGPRTCENVNNLWGACNTCPHWKKIVSPVSLKGDKFIATRDNGFHTVNRAGRLFPSYDDLYKFYLETHPYVNINGTHYRFTGTHYERVHDDAILMFAENNFRPKPTQSVANEFRAKIRRNYVENGDFFSRDFENKINLSNGILDTETMELSPHSPSYGFTATLPFAYDPIAEAPMFSRFMSDVTCGDKELEEILLEYLGYAISNAPPLAQKALMLVGEGSNGKSTFVQILKALAGQGAMALAPSQYENHFDTFRLLGASVCITEEMDRYMKDSWFERFKALVTGGDVTASLKGKDSITFQARAKFILTCNELPKGANPNEGYYRRLLIAPFNATFTEGKNLVRGIDEKIIANELPGVLNRVLEAFSRLRARAYSFTASGASQAALHAHRLDTDHVARWAEESIAYSHSEATLEKVPANAPSWYLLTPGGTPVASIPEMRKCYEAWTLAQGEKPVSEKRFNMQLIRYARDRKWPELEQFQVKVKGKPIRCFKGITYTDDAEL